MSAHRPSPSHAVPGGGLAREGPPGPVVRAAPRQNASAATTNLLARGTSEPVPNGCRLAERISAGGSLWDRRGGHGGPIFLAFRESWLFGRRRTPLAPAAGRRGRRAGAP